MRSLLVVAMLCSIARGSPIPMRVVADAQAACASLKGPSADAKAKCETVAKASVKGLGNVALAVAKVAGMNRYAVIVGDTGKMSMSEPVELVTDTLDDAKPSLHTVTINGKPAAAAAIDQRRHEHTDRWTATTVIACGRNDFGGVCSTRTWGGRGNSCKVVVKADGSVVATCETIDSLAFDGSPPPANASVDAVMEEAVKAYDRGDYDKARERANAVLATQPDNPRMLRILVSVACITGDAHTAQKNFTRLPTLDRIQMKTRCYRYGVTLTE